MNQPLALCPRDRSFTTGDVPGLDHQDHILPAIIRIRSHNHQGAVQNGCHGALDWMVRIKTIGHLHKLDECGLRLDLLSNRCIKVLARPVNHGCLFDGLDSF